MEFASRLIFVVIVAVIGYIRGARAKQRHMRWEILEDEIHYIFSYLASANGDDLYFRDMCKRRNITRLKLRRFMFYKERE